MGHIVIRIDNEKDWHNARHKGIGGSDVASILGLNPYKTNVELWREKTGRTKPSDISQKPCVQYGKKAEDYLREIFILDYPEYEVCHRPYDIHIHNDYDFIRASLDGEILTKINPTKGILEIKTTEIRRSVDWEKWRGKIPMNYFCQTLHYMLIDPDYKFCKLKAQIKHKDNFREIEHITRHYHILREKHQKDIDYLLEKELEFWEYVKADKEPPLLLPEI